MGHRVVTIGRQYGSGGKEVGEKLAAKLGIPCYDWHLIQMAAERGGFDLERVTEMDEKAASPWSYGGAGTAVDFFSYSGNMNDQLQRLQADIIRELAAKEDCVIVGRCADSVLKGECLSAFIYATDNARIKRLRNTYGLSEKEAVQRMKGIDKKRAAYYNYYSDKTWGEKESYDIMLSSSDLGIDACVDILAELYEKM